MKSFLPVLLLAIGSAAAQVDEPAPARLVSDGVTAVDKLNAYIDQNRCTVAKTTKCLEKLTYNACASGCPRVGYSWRATTAERIDLHMSHAYLKLLRNAAVQFPTATTAYSLGLTLDDLLWHQVQMFLRSPLARFRTADLTPLTLRDITTGARHAVDPLRFHSVAWVNLGGTAHAMQQADIAIWLQSVAVEWARRGHSERAVYYLQLSERAFRTFGIRDEEGGVRNNKRGHHCFEGLYCYWFHSFVVGDDAEPSTVLNQHLHAVRDAMVAHDQLVEWRDQGLLPIDGGRPVPLPNGLDPNHIDQLSEWARGGLFQLAYAAGNGVDPDAPPNLREFLWRAGRLGGVLRYHAAYRFEFSDGPANIRPGNTCHYHYHSMSLLARILELIQSSPTFSGDRYFVDIYCKLLYGRAAGDRRGCHAPTPSSDRVMNGVPLAEMYVGGVSPLPFRIYCDGIANNDSEVPLDENDVPLGEYDDSALWSASSYMPRAFYEQAYGSCLFPAVLPPEDPSDGGPTQPR